MIPRDSQLNKKVSIASACMIQYKYFTHTKVMVNKSYESPLTRKEITASSPKSVSSVIIFHIVVVGRAVIRIQNISA